MSIFKIFIFYTEGILFFFKEKKLIKNLLLASFLDCILVGRRGRSGRWEEGELPLGQGVRVAGGRVGRTWARSDKAGVAGRPCQLSHWRLCSCLTPGDLLSL